MIVFWFGCIGGTTTARVQSPADDRVHPWGPGRIQEPVSIWKLHQTLAGGHRIALSLEQPLNVHGKAFSNTRISWSPSSSLDLEQVHETPAFHDAATFALSAFNSAQEANPPARHVQYELAGTPDEGVRLSPTAVSDATNAWVAPINPHDFEVTTTLGQPSDCLRLLWKVTADVAGQIELPGVMFRGAMVGVDLSPAARPHVCTPLEGNATLRAHLGSIMRQVGEQTGEQ